MNRRKLLVASLATLAAVIVAVLAWRHVGTHETPAGQPPLAALDAASIATLKADFNGASNETRLIVLLSPT